jgi:hypothetical protein
VAASDTAATIGYRGASSPHFPYVRKQAEVGISGRAENVFARVGSWVSSEAMTDLINLFDDGRAADPADWPDWVPPLLASGTSPLPGLSTAQTETLRRTLRIERVATPVFNFRSDDSNGYTERPAAADANFDDHTRARVLDLTRRLGLVDPRKPQFDRYDKTLILGGRGLSPLLRTQYAAQIRDSGVELGEVSFLGSPRPLIEEPPEREVVAGYAPDATDEFDLMLGAVRAAYGMEVTEPVFLCGCADDSAHCPRWLQRLAKHAAETPPEFTHERRALVVDRDGRPAGSVLSASTGRPPLRPDTANTLDLWARCTDPRPGQRVLLVTTQVFVPFQTFDALRLLYLPYDVEIDAVGLGPEWKDRPTTAEYLLQETLSAIRSARRLLTDATPALTA